MSMKGCEGAQLGCMRGLVPTCITQSAKAKIRILLFLLKAPQYVSLKGGRLADGEHDQKCV